MTDLELISIRLTKLETRLRRIKRAAMLAGIMLAGGLVMAQLRPQDLNQLDPLQTIKRPDQSAIQKPVVEAEVRAEHFILVDQKGRDRASLVADGAGSVFLVMFDSNRKTRAQLSVGNEGPSLIFYDAGGQPRTIIGSTTMVPSHVNDNGVAEKGPASSIVLLDRAGKLLWRQP